jgi:hypothetical protein
MANNKSQYVWVQKPSKPTFDANSKTRMLQAIQEHIKCMEKLRQKVSRIDMRGNRVYLYHLVEPFRIEGVTFTKPLIDDNYFEFPYARITLLKADATNCTVDWQRHNDQWISLYEGTLDECLNNIENDNGWFG